LRNRARSASRRGEAPPATRRTGGEDAAGASRAARAARLRTQDSLAIAHARLDKEAKAKAAKAGQAATAPTAAAKQAEASTVTAPATSGPGACVDDVVVAHVKLTVSAVLRAVARALPPSSAREVLVAGAVYDLDAGRARLLRVGWTSGRDFYYDRLESAD
jgi:hypothetical protein